MNCLQIGSANIYVNQSLQVCWKVKSSVNNYSDTQSSYDSWFQYIVTHSKDCNTYGNKTIANYFNQTKKTHRMVQESNSPKEILILHVTKQLIMYWALKK